MRQTNLLEGMRVAILAGDDVEQSELVEPKKALESAGATTALVSPHAGSIQGVNHDEKADTFPVDITLDQADPDEFDGMLLPGGALNADALRVEPRAQAFARRIDEQNKPIAVICHGPWLLISAGLVHGRTLTSYQTIQDDLRNAGGHWLNLEVVCDGNWVSSRSPRDLPAFNREMLARFAAYYAERQDAGTAA